VESRARVRLELLAGKKRLARGTATATSLVCGSRTLTVRVTRTAGSGPFTLMVSRP
jgi:hypothetical protein